MRWLKLLGLYLGLYLILWATRTKSPD